MSKIALISDLHIRGKDFKNKIGLLAETKRICEEKKVDYILNLGDTFDRGDVGDKHVPSELMVKGYTDIFSSGPPMIMLAGNHDLYGATGNALDFIHMSNVTKVQDKAEIIYLEDFDVACIPWIRDNKDYYQEVISVLNSYKKPIKEKPRFLIGHLNIINCAIGKHGYCTPDHYFSFNLHDLVHNNFLPNNVYLGHIHRRINLGNNSMYLGAMAQLRFDEDEGKDSGFYILDSETKKLEFINLNYIASQYYTIKNEKDLHKYDTTRHYVRFYTETPERYKHLLPNVKAMLKQDTSQLAEEVKSVYEQSKSDELSINNLVARYCLLKDKQEPTSDFYLQEKSRLSVGLVKKSTGFDRIKRIQIKNLISINDQDIEFKDGFTCITGQNGSGKSTISEILPASLYEYFPSRGNIKNYMKKDTTITIDVEALGRPYRVFKELHNKKVQSSLNDTTYSLTGTFKSAVEPIFGEASMFNRLVLADQGNQNDLVTAKDSERLKLLRELFDLNSFDLRFKEYSEQLRECKKDLENYSKLSTEINSIRKEYEDIHIASEDLSFYSKDLTEKISLLNKMLSHNRKCDSTLLQQAEINAIDKYELDNNIKSIKEKIIRINYLQTKLGTARNWKEVGCRNNPLPCIFIKNLDLSNLEDSEKELTNLLQSVNMKEYTTYSRLKGSLQARTAGEQTLTPYSQVTIDKLQSEITELKELKLKIDHNIMLTKLKNNLSNRIKSKEEELHNFKSKEDLEEKIKDLQFLQEICGKYGLSLYIINLIKVELQAILNNLIEMSELNIQVDLSTNNLEDLDSLKILFGPDKFDINLASGGQIALVRILFKLTIMMYLNKYFGTYKTIILDEPTAALDTGNTEAVIEILRKLKSSFHQIIVSTHSTRVANSADHRIEIK